MNHKIREFAGLIGRLLVGTVFMVSGFSKAIAPPQEFAAVIEAYRVFPARLIFPAAVAIPWVELIAGLFLVLGHRVRASASVLAGLLAAFILLLSSAVARGLSLDQCGCFGSLVHLSPPQALLSDSLMFLGALAAARWGAMLFALDLWIDGRTKK